MKTIVKMLMCLACVALLASCEKEPESLKGAINPDAMNNFTASFIVHDHTDYSTRDARGGCLKIWKGAGESPVLGRFLVEISLVCHFEQMLFLGLIGSFVSEDGSTLFFSIPKGEYCSQNACAMFQCSFNTLAEISGGTGRFEGATGKFYPNAKISNGIMPDWFAEFSCQGNIQLKPVRPLPGEPSHPIPLP
jgi:hypothetical protein